MFRLTVLIDGPDEPTEVEPYAAADNALALMDLFSAQYRRSSLFLDGVGHVLAASIDDARTGETVWEFDVRRALFTLEV